jgi:hypothetical protein
MTNAVMLATLLCGLTVAALVKPPISDQRLARLGLLPLRPSADLLEQVPPTSLRATWQ